MKYSRNMRLLFIARPIFTYLYTQSILYLYNLICMRDSMGMMVFMDFINKWRSGRLFVYMWCYTMSFITIHQRENVYRYLWCGTK